MSEELWAQIAGYPNYEVSNLGRVRSCVRTDGLGRKQGGRVLAQQLTPHGRAIVRLYSESGGKSNAVSKLVARAFLGELTGKCVCHNNGDPLDNRVANLRYDTQAGNCADKKRHGTAQFGERIGNARLTVSAVRIIRKRHADGASYTAIASDVGVSPSTVGNVVRGDFWSHVT